MGNAVSRAEELRILGEWEFCGVCAWAGRLPRAHSEEFVVRGCRANSVRRRDDLQGFEADDGASWRVGGDFWSGRARTRCDSICKGDGPSRGGCGSGPGENDAGAKAWSRNYD